jgi:hypothetical protein
MSAAEERYRRAWRSITRGLWSGVLTYVQAYEEALVALRRGMRSAWHEGLAEFGIQPDEMTSDEKAALEGMTVGQSQYINGFLVAIEERSRAKGGKLSPLFTRAGMWIQRYNEARERAKSLASANPKLKWFYGDTIDHCFDCRHVVGRVYRKETWDRYGWIPGSRSLSCGGWQCDCKRRPTDERCTPGRPPDMKG